MGWSRPIRLRECLDAPRQHGVYEVGFLRDGVFRPMYVGRATNPTIQGRLRRHYEGDGNAYIRDYLDDAWRDNLYCRWEAMDPDLARKKEAILLLRHEIGLNGGRYEWNDRREFAALFDDE